MLDGAEPFGGSWTRCASAADCRGNPNYAKIYVTSAPSGYDFQAGTFQDASFLWFSQDPNPADPFHYDRTEYLRTIPLADASVFHTRTSVTDPRVLTQSDPDYYAGAYVLVWRQPNVTVIRRITGYSPATHTITHEDLGGDVYPDRDTGYALLNHPAFIDTPGEYAFDAAANRLYVWPLESADPAAHEFSVAQRHTGLYASGASFLDIEGFIVQKYTMGIRAIDSGAQDVRIRNNHLRTMRVNDAYALQVGGRNMLVESNRVVDCQRAVGILAGGSNITVRANFVRRTSRNGIWFMGVDHGQIVDNVVDDISGTHANGISLYLFNRDILVAGNQVWNTGSSLTYHGNGSASPPAENLILCNNVFEYAVNSWGKEMGDVTVVNNTFLGVANVGGDAGHDVFVNNIVHGGGSGDVRRHNLYTALAWWQDARYGWALAEGELQEENRNVVFESPAAGNYRLAAGSPAKDAGTNPLALLPVALFPDYDLTRDLAGNPRPQGAAWDMGAFERSAGAAPAPPAPPNGLRISSSR
ncbi:MAG: right-handed parallel beta-helix repeat-containing protein [Kiritimatiellae bacterium]|nr:right-handed parallel beta-helix repeat-containing protein [Kiritimatiellia bacterium]